MYYLHVIEFDAFLEDLFHKLHVHACTTAANSTTYLEELAFVPIHSNYLGFFVQYSTIR